MRQSSGMIVLVLACLLLPAAAWTQISYTGTAANQNFGSVALGTTSAVKTFSFSVAAGTTVGSIGALTTGISGLDFKIVTGGTCADTTYTSAAACTVDATFKPKFAGLRMGAVVFFSAAGDAGTVLGSVQVYGIGTGPQIVFSPAPAVNVSLGTGYFGGTSALQGLVVDPLGDQFFSTPDGFQGSAVVIYPANSGVTFITTTFDPFSLALDGAGNLFISDSEHGKVEEVSGPWGIYEFARTEIDPTVNGIALSNPSGLAVDGTDDLFIADTGNDRVVEVPAGGGAATAFDPNVNGKELSGPLGVAVDAAGDLFIADTGNNRVVEVPTGGGTATAIAPSVNGQGLAGPNGVVVDGAGDLFIEDAGNNRIVDVPAAGGSPTVIGTGFSLEPATLTLDDAGDLYFACASSICTEEVPRSQAPALNFPTLTAVGSTDTTDGTQAVQVQNVGNEALTLTSAFPADFSEASGDASACAVSGSLAAGQQCSLPIDFTPLNAGVLSENVTLTDNALNVTGAQQLIAVTGTGITSTEATHFSVTTTATAYAGIPFAVTVTALDISNQTATSFNGTVSFSSSDGTFLNPGPLTLANGVGQAPVTFNTLGTQTITVTDTGDAAFTGSGSFPVLVDVMPVGTSSSGNFGSQAIGSSSSAKSLSFSIAGGATVGSIAVVTTGIANMDFANAAGSTCTAMTYASATTCTINVTFTPKAVGLRMGAVVFFSGAENTGAVMASVPVNGIGTGPQIAYGPATAIAVGSLGYPSALATDAAGDLFMLSWDYPWVVGVAEVPAGGVTPTYLYYTGIGMLPTHGGLALDGAGDLFVVPWYTSGVLEMPVGGGAHIVLTPTVNGEGLSNPQGVAVDGAGDMFFADTGNNRVVEMPSGGGAATEIDPTVNGEELSGPKGLAVDSAGDLFIADAGNLRVVEVPAGGGTPIAISPTANGEGLSLLDGITVDGAGDLFIADINNNRVVEVPAGGGTAIAIGPPLSGGPFTPGLFSPDAVAVDGGGNLFIADNQNARNVKVQRSQPPALNFPTATLVGAIDTPDGTQTVQIQNVGNEALIFTALSYPADFSEASGDTNACTGSTSLSAGQECDLPIEFTPVNAGILSENVTLTDNALNVAGTRQAIAVSGSTPATLTSPKPRSVLAGPSVTFTWSAAVGATGYQLWLGLNGAGSSDLYVSGSTTATSLNVTGLPAKGATIYARLFSEGGGKEHYSDYTYTEAGMPATMISPTAGSALGTSNVKFTWTAGMGATQYQLWLGLSGPGSSSLYTSGWLTAPTTSTTVTSLPAKGATVYARLYSMVGGAIFYNDYSYTEAGTPAMMIFPTAGSTLGTSNVQFTWTAGSGATQYQLWLGLSGPGSSSLYVSGWLTAPTTSTTVTSLPAKGAMVYARLYSDVDGVVEYNDYTYVEQ